MTKKNATKKKVRIRDLGYDIDVPENRRLYPGDRVEIGNLEDCVVVETSDEFKYVTIEYTSIDNNYGNPIVTKGCIGEWTWMDVFPYSDDDEREFAVQRDNVVNYVNTDLEGMVNSIFNRGMVDSPDYQRGYVWTEEDKLRYVESAFKDLDLGKFIFVHDATYKDYRLEVLDGKQRLSALIEFVTSQLKYKGKYFHEMSRKDRRLFKSRMVQTATIDRNTYSRTDLLNLFLEVNAAGVPQTEEHLEYVRGLLAEEAK
jgi:hypothetical protein